MTDLLIYKIRLSSVNRRESYKIYNRFNQSAHEKHGIEKSQIWRFMVLVKYSIVYMCAQNISPVSQNLVNSRANIPAHRSVQKAAFRQKFATGE